MENPLHILIVEDDENDAALIIRHINKTEFDISFEVVDSAAQMKTALEKQQYDFVISDFSLPQFNALQALKILQATGFDIPFIVVSGTVGEETAVEIMKAGAHDYIMKDNLSRLVPVFRRELAEVANRSEHKIAEDRIRMQARLLDLIGQSVITVDINQTITFWNKASENLFGWSSEEVLGRKLNEVLVHHASQPLTQKIMTCIRNGESWSRESDIVSSNGTLIPTHVTHTPLFDEQGDITGFIGISFDVTERRKAEEEMIQKIEELAASNDELNRINQVTIGREMRMIELKHHCNALAVQLGIERPYPLAFLNDTDDRNSN